MNDRIAKQAYDRGYDAGVADKAKTAATPGQNPYKPTRALRTYSRYELWDMGYADGFAGRPRRTSQSEADEIRRDRLEKLEEIARAVVKLGNIADRRDEAAEEYGPSDPIAGGYDRDFEMLFGTTIKQARALVGDEKAAAS